MSVLMSLMGGGGKGGGFKWGGKGGGGKDPKKEAHKRSMEKIQKIDAEKKVWIGGLKSGTTWKELEKHIVDTTGTKPKVTEMMGKTGVAAYGSAEDATSAIAALNGSELGGSTIEADVWTQKDPSEKREKKSKSKNGGSLDPKKDLRSQIGAVAAESKLWVGGLSKKTDADELKSHFSGNGCEPDMARIMRPGTACITFNSAEEASAALATLNGTELDGQTLEVDVWSKTGAPK